MIIVDNKPLFITETTNLLGKGSNSNSFLITAKEVTLDFLFNYDSAIVEFTSDNTRSKRNFSEGLQGTTIQPDPIEVSPISNSTFSKDEKGITFKFIDTEFELNAESNNATGTVGVSLKGNITINPGVDFFMEYNPKFTSFNQNSEFDNYIAKILALNPATAIAATGITLGTMKQMKGVFYCDLDFATDFSVELKGEFEKEIYKKKITTIRKVYSVRKIPISSVTEISLEFNAKTEATLSYNYQKRDENDFVAGFNYTNSANQPAKVTWTYNKDSRTITNSYLEAKIELSAELALVLKTELYVLGVLGPKFEPKAYTESKLSYTVSSNLPVPYWEASMDIGLKADISLDLSLFHWDKGTWEFFKKDNIFDFKTNIYNAPDKVNVIFGDNQEGLINKELSQKIQVEVLDSYKNKVLLPAPVYFDGGTRTNFHGTPEEPYVIYNPIKGNAENKWTLGNKEGSQKMLTYLKQLNGSIFGVTDTIYAIGKKGEDVYNGSVTLKTQEEVKEFGSNKYIEVTGVVFIGRYDDESIISNITDLSPLSSLTKLSELYIYNNPKLLTLQGLENIKTVHSLGLKNNNISNLTGLNSLTEVTYSLDILNNSSLLNLNGLNDELTNVGFLTIANNSSLNTLEGLINISSVNRDNSSQSKQSNF